MKPSILVTLCARGGSKGVKNKNLRPLLGKPLIQHTIDLAKSWNKADCIGVSTDSEAIAEEARKLGVEVPFLRPPELATDQAGKIPVITHALKEMERIHSRTFEYVVDLDATAPIRSLEDLERGWRVSQESGADVVFSVCEARKNPYFNMVVMGEGGQPELVCKPQNGGVVSRQSAPQIWELNASIYFYKRSYLLQNPQTLWEGKARFFEMPEDTAFDIDHERDLWVVEALLRARNQDGAR